MADSEFNPSLVPDKLPTSSEPRLDQCPTGECIRGRFKNGGVMIFLFRRSFSCEEALVCASSSWVFF